MINFILPLINTLIKVDNFFSRYTHIISLSSYICKLGYKIIHNHVDNLLFEILAYIY